MSIPPGEPRARVIGVGAVLGGDDAVGHRVAAAVRQGELPPGVEVTVVSDPADLVPLVDGVSRVLVVDAVAVAGLPGQVLVLTLDQCEAGRAHPVSSHGMGVGAALKLGHTLADHPARDVRIVGITINAEVVGGAALSPEVEAAVPAAAARVRALLEEV